MATTFCVMVRTKTNRIYLLPDPVKGGTVEFGTQEEADKAAKECEQGQNVASVLVSQTPPGLPA